MKVIGVVLTKTHRHNLVREKCGIIFTSGPDDGIWHTGLVLINQCASPEHGARTRVTATTTNRHKDPPQTGHVDGVRAKTKPVPSSGLTIKNEPMWSPLVTNITPELRPATTQEQPGCTTVSRIAFLLSELNEP